ncbi:MAG TPA: hypothetical protein VF533_14010 [Solirubrobacteraceae bacterium]|jgi:tetratricopeptide (TPR) repeat protein
MRNVSEDEYRRSSLDYQASLALEARRIGLSLESVTGSFRSGFADLDRRVVDLAVTLDLGVEALAQELSRQSHYLEQMTSILANPAATAANERQRWGLKNLERGLLEEAESDLWRGLDAFPYDSVSFLALGQIATLKQQWSSAVELFKKAYRYSVTDDGGLAAGAALQAAAAAHKAADEKESRAILEAATRDLPDCPELWFALSRLTQEPEHLRRALVLKPRLALDGRALGMRHVDEAAEQAYRLEVEPLLDRLRSVLSGVEVDHRLHPPGSDPVAALLNGVQELRATPQLARSVREGGGTTDLTEPTSPKLKYGFPAFLLLGGFAALYVSSVFHESTDMSQFNASGPVRSVGLVLLALAVAITVARGFRHSRQRADYKLWEARAREADSRSRRLTKAADEIGRIVLPTPRIVEPFVRSVRP